MSIAGIAERYFKDNWAAIAKGRPAPGELAILKLGGQSSSAAPMNFSVFVDEDEEPAYLVKMNRVPGEFGALEDEFNNLKIVSGPVSRIGGCLAPQPVFFSKADDFTAMLVETFLPGEKIGAGRFTELSALFPRAFTWLKAFYIATKKDAIFTYEEYIKEAFMKKVPKTEFGARIGNEDLAIPVSSSQGDFDFDNLLVSKDALGIIDWEDYRAARHPFFDAEFFIFNAALYFYKKDSHVESFDRFFRRGSGTYKLADMYISDYCRFLNVDKKVFYAVSIMDTIAIIRSGHGRHKRVPMQDAGFLDRLIDLAARETR